MGYAIENEFMIGADVPGEEGSRWSYRYRNRNIVLNSISGVFSQDVIGNELAVDTFSFVARYNDKARGVYKVRDSGNVYRCAGVYPGSLEESGWVTNLGDSRDTLIENEIKFYGSVQASHIMEFKPPVDSTHPSGYFIAGDELEINISVLNNPYNQAEFDMGPFVLGNRHSFHSETGLFSRWTNDWFRAHGTGEDVLTFTWNSRTESNGTLRFIGVAGETVVINGMKFNGKTIYGTIRDDLPENQPPKVYLLKPPYAAKDYLSNVPYGTPTWWKIAGTLYARGYLSSVERQGRFAWKITCVSGVGLLTAKQHAGGIYNGQTFKSVFESIVGDAFPFTVKNDIKNTRVYGWLKYDTARNNLHKLLFAVGGALVKPSYADGYSGDYDVRFLPTSIKNVSSGRVAMGGSVKVTLPADGVEITEHSFSALTSVEDQVLYDNTQGDTGVANNQLIVFSEPIIVETLTTTDTLTFSEAGVNYAIVSGMGTLTGKPYTHNRTIIALGNVAGTNIKRVTENALVSPANSLNVARRILSYFQSARKLSAKIQLNPSSPERCGQNLKFTDSWGELTTAYLTKMQLSVTSVRAASCDLVADYFPGNNGNNFTHYQYIKLGDPNTWTVPEGVELIRVVLIQGGSGGSGGWNGHNGWGNYPPMMGDPEDGELVGEEFPIYNDVHQQAGTGKTYYYGDGRQQSMPGGDAGNAGDSGKILVLTQIVGEGEVLTFSVGSGGTGGAGQGNNDAPAEGTAGGETSVSSDAGWSASTEDGAISEIGYHDVLGNKDLALPGEAGHAGGSGGMSDKISTSKSINGGAGYDGGRVGSYAGGKGGKGVKHSFGYMDYMDAGSGGGGGGGAWGASGGDGGDATYHPSTDNTNQYIYTGKGGAGANAKYPSKPTYGCGGGGGNGGGGGGNIGGGVVYKTNQGFGADLTLGIRTGDDPDHPYIPTSDNFGGGKGGKGSRGGHGGDGVAIIYW